MSFASGHSLFIAVLIGLKQKTVLFFGIRFIFFVPIFSAIKSHQAPAALTTIFALKSSEFVMNFHLLSLKINLFV